MPFEFTRHNEGQSQGVFTNLWPTTGSKLDRITIGAWYFVVQVGSWKFDFTGEI